MKSVKSRIDKPARKRRTTQPRRKSTTRPKPVNLALQGGGSHGAFTWGVLDRLLEDGRVEIEAISQFTSLAFTQVLNDADIKISMDGKGRWMDNVFIERLWRSLKYECVYLQAFETGTQARAGIGSWIDYYNQSRPHSALAGRTPEEAYYERLTQSPGQAPEMAPEALAA